MTNACPIPTPTEREYGAILSGIEDELLGKIHAALEHATERAESELDIANTGRQPPTPGYFAARVHQHMYCMMCGADPKTFEGGRADAALAVIRNSQNIARHYWGAKLEPSAQA